MRKKVVKKNILGGFYEVFFLKKLEEETENYNRMRETELLLDGEVKPLFDADDLVLLSRNSWTQWKSCVRAGPWQST